MPGREVGRTGAPAASGEQGVAAPRSHSPHSPPSPRHKGSSLWRDLQRQSITGIFHMG